MISMPPITSPTGSSRTKNHSGFGASVAMP
jgi:hypothetical protein